MIVGLPKEIKKDEHRTALAPAAVEALVEAGHEVIVEKGGGLGAGIGDAEYTEVGGQIAPRPTRCGAGPR